MNSQDFLILNLAAAGTFVLWYLLSRGGARRPTQLNLHAKDSGPSVLPPQSIPSSSAQHIEAAPQLSAREAGASQRDMGVGTDKNEKDLNIMFNYNGHSWDAYEVLGVPAGASLRLVTEAYQTAIKASASESMEFLETAYSAILDSKTRL